MVKKCVSVILKGNVVGQERVMIATKQLWFLQQTQVQPLQRIIPTLAGGLMVISGLMPWLNDPLGATISGWSIPLDVGWQFHTAILNYGLLCTCIAGYVFLVALAQWRPFPGSDVLMRRRTTAGLLCLVPVVLLF